MLYEIKEKSFSLSPCLMMPTKIEWRRRSSSSLILSLILVLLVRTSSPSVILPIEEESLPDYESPQYVQTINYEHVRSSTSQQQTLLSAPVSVPGTGTVPQQELDALYALFESTRGEDWLWRNVSEMGPKWNFTIINTNTNTTNTAETGDDDEEETFVTGTPCDQTTGQWQGIVCNCSQRSTDDDDGYFYSGNNNGGKHTTQYCNIQALNLTFYNLTGSIPDAITNLTELTYLSLASNRLLGTVPILHLIKNLSYLDLEINTLVGPLSFFELNRKLETVYLADNKFTGTIPPIQALPLLTHFGVSKNYLVGSIPTLAENSKLKSIFLANNSLTNTIPSLASLSQLEYINFNNNKLIGTIPPLENLTSLNSLDLQNNRLTGPLPAGLDLLQKLEYLELNNNAFSGSFPRYLPPTLKSLFLQANNLAGSLVADTFRNMPALADLNLDANHFSGVLPTTLSLLTELETMHIRNNEFIGKLDGVFNASTQDKLYLLQLSSNDLTGTIPEEIFKLRALTEFAAASNCLIGPLPIEAICAHNLLSTLVLNGLHTGPSCRTSMLGNFNPNIYELRDSHAHLADQLHSCLFSMRSLEILHMSGNGLTGTIPYSLNDSVPDRFEMPFSRNDSIIGRSSHRVIKDLILSHNYLSGDIPRGIQEQEEWDQLDLSYNRLSGVLSKSFTKAFQNKEGGHMKHVSALTPKLKLNLNRLSGEIPGSLYNALDVTILEGNLFECDLSGSNLPLNDDERTEYSCASNEFAVPYYAWLSSLFLVAVVFVLAVRQWQQQQQQQQGIQKSGDGIIYDSSKSKSNTSSSFSDAVVEEGVINPCLDAANNMQQQSNKTGTGSNVQHTADRNNTRTEGLTAETATGIVPPPPPSPSPSPPPSSSSFHSATTHPKRPVLDSPFSVLLQIVVGFGMQRGKDTLTNVQCQLQQGLQQFQQERDTFDDVEGETNRPSRLTTLIINDTTYSNRASRVIQLPQLSNISALQRLFSGIRRLLNKGMLYILLILSPLYIVCGLYDSTYTYRYSWVVSAGFLGGRLSAALLYCALTFYILSVALQYRQLIAAQEVTAANVEGDNSTAGDHDSNTQEHQEEQERQRSTFSDKLQENVLVIHQRFMKVLPFVGAVVVNILVIGLINCLFVWVSIYHSSKLNLFLAQSGLSIVSLLWNSNLERAMVERLASMTNDVRNSDVQNKMVALELYLAILNAIVIPIFTIAILDKTCLYNLLVPPEEVTTSYIYVYKGCEMNHCGHFPAKSTTSFIPPFVFSYQCSSTIIRRYSTSILFTCILMGFVNPLKDMILLYIYSRELHMASQSANSSPLFSFSGLRSNSSLGSSSSSSVHPSNPGSHLQDGNNTITGRLGVTNTNRGSYIDNNNNNFNNYGNDKVSRELRYPPWWVRFVITKLVPPVLKPVPLTFELPSNGDRTRSISSVTITAIADINSENEATSADRARNFQYFDSAKYLAQLVLPLVQLLTFGILFPPLGLAIFVSMIVHNYFLQIKIAMFVQLSKEIGAMHQILIFEKECGTFVLPPEKWLLVLLSVTCVTYSFCIFNISADEVGFDDSWWILVTMGIVLPLLLFSLDTVSTSLWWREWNKSKQESGNTTISTANTTAHTRSTDGVQMLMSPLPPIQ